MNDKASEMQLAGHRPTYEGKGNFALVNRTACAQIWVVKLSNNNTFTVKRRVQMGNYRLPNGREIYLVRWSMAGTYSGILEGTKEYASQFIRENLPDRVAQIMPPGHPLALIGPPPMGVLPPWLCVAMFESRSGVHNNDGDFNSLLYACWFMEDYARSLHEIIESILPEIEWEKLAEDYDIMNF